MTQPKSPNESAEVIMVCGHHNIYARCIPRFGDLAWCPRCDTFKPVKIVEVIPPKPEPPVSYSKSVPITTYTNTTYRHTHAHSGRKGS